MSAVCHRLKLPACIKYFIIYLNVGLVLSQTVSLTEVYTTEVNKCPEAYKYKNFQSKEMFLPDALVSNGEGMRLRFGLKYTGCEDGETIKVSLPVHNSTREVFGTTLHKQLPNQFLPDGKLRFQSHYYYTEDYCVSRSNETHVNVEICNRPCDSESRPCIPKCCDLNEVIEYDTGNSSYKCSPSGKLQWKPFLYETPHRRLLSTENSLVKPQFVKIEMKQVWFEKWPLADLTHFQQTWRRRLWRILSSGQIVYLAKNRSWTPITDGQLCIDGIQNVHGEGDFNGDESNQIIFYIPNSLPSQDHHSLSQLYGIASFISSCFYLIIVLVYLVLAKIQKVQGWLVLSYVLALFFTSLLLGTVHYLEYLSELGRNSIIQLKTPQSALLAVFTHFFILSSYCWITVMSFDLLLTFRSVIPSSSRSKGVKRYVTYNTIGWGVPLVVVSIAILLDHLYEETETEVPIPDYGKHNYFIAKWSLGLYHYYIIAVILAINLMLVLITAGSIWKFRRSIRSLSKTDLSTKNSDYLSFKLYFKLFIVSGVLWSFEILSWFHAGNENPWYWVTLDMIANLQSGALFVIFICNRRTLNQLKERCTGIQKSVVSSMKQFSFRRSSSSTSTIEITHTSF